MTPGEWFALGFACAIAAFSLFGAFPILNSYELDREDHHDGASS